MMPAYQLYRFVTSLTAPLWTHFLHARRKRGKEDAARFTERLGIASIPRPAGRVIWLHASSVGEANSALPLIEALRRRLPFAHLLLTTGTVTSARLMRERLPVGALHQFAPIDTPQAVARFLAHWRPDAALWVESELWPNLVLQTAQTGCVMALINARMSVRSYKGWLRCRSLIRDMLNSFAVVFPQSENDTTRFRWLGATDATCLGNLKYDGIPLPLDAASLIALEEQAKGRQRWLAASIHLGEDAIIAAAAKQLQALTVVVPRHPERGTEMRKVFEEKGLIVAQRSLGETISSSTNVYLADTLGELGLFYRFCPIAFIGGSLIFHGGQNPLEPARLGSAILFGPNMFNFRAIADGLEDAQAALVVEATTLVEQVELLLADDKRRAGMQARASAWAAGQAGVCERLIDRLMPLLAKGGGDAAGA